jgi:hypothetical protein
MHVLSLQMLTIFVFARRIGYTKSSKAKGGFAMKKQKRKHERTIANALPQNSAARLPDTQMPREVLNPESKNSVADAKKWVDEHTM